MVWRRVVGGHVTYSQKCRRHKRGGGWWWSFYVVGSEQSRKYPTIPTRKVAAGEPS
jgi:hypothetical protein